MYINELWSRLQSTSLFGADYWGAIIFVLVILGFLFIPSSIPRIINWLKKMKESAKLKWLQFPYRIAISIFFIGCFVGWTQFNMYEDMKTNLNQEITGLRDRLSSFTKLEYLPPILEGQKVKSPSSADITVTFTPNFDPDFIGTIKQPIHNPDKYNHIFEIVRFKMESSLRKYASEIKFTSIDKSLIPPNVIILSDYQGTKYIIAIIEDIPPDKTIEFEFPIYAMEADKDIENTARLTYEILDTKVIP